MGVKKQFNGSDCAIIKPCTVKFDPMASLGDMLRKWLMCTFFCSKGVQEYPCKIYNDFTSLYTLYVCQGEQLIK